MAWRKFHLIGMSTASFINKWCIIFSYFPFIVLFIKKRDFGMRRKKYPQAKTYCFMIHIYINNYCNLKNRENNKSLRCWTKNDLVVWILFPEVPFSQGRRDSCQQSYDGRRGPGRLMFFEEKITNDYLLGVLSL